MFSTIFSRYPYLRTTLIYTTRFVVYLTTYVAFLASNDSRDFYRLLVRLLPNWPLDLRNTDTVLMMQFFGLVGLSLFVAFKVKTRPQDASGMIAFFERNPRLKRCLLRTARWTSYGVAATALLVLLNATKIELFLREVFPDWAFNIGFPNTDTLALQFFWASALLAALLCMLHRAPRRPEATLEKY